MRPADDTAANPLSNRVSQPTKQIGMAICERSLSRA